MTYENFEKFKGKTVRNIKFQCNKKLRELMTH